MCNPASCFFNSPKVINPRSTLFKLNFDSQERNVWRKPLPATEFIRVVELGVCLFHPIHPIQ